MGRPAIEITEEICDKAESLAAQGLTMAQIADVLGLGERTLYEKQRDYPQLAQSIKRGQANGVAVVCNSLFESAKGETVFEDKVVKAKDGGEKVVRISKKMAANPTSCIFYLKNRAGWKDSRDVKHSGNITHEHEGISRTLEILREFRGLRSAQPVEGPVQN